MEKKRFKITVPTVCCVIAALLLIYAFYSAGSTVHDIREYYKAYDGVNASAKEYITYTLQAVLQPLVYAITIYMCGYLAKQGKETRELILSKLDEPGRGKAPAKKKAENKGGNSEKPRKKSLPKESGKKKETEKKASDKVDSKEEEDDE